MNTTEFWAKFWENFDEDPEKIEDIEGFIFKDKSGRWLMAVAPPNDNRLIVIQVYYNPFTGEELK